VYAGGGDYGAGVCAVVVFARSAAASAGVRLAVFVGPGRNKKRKKRLLLKKTSPTHMPRDFVCSRFV
ncbi:hypothetical protein ACVGW2_25600, partial [Enterobacter intestinihominis]